MAASFAWVVADGLAKRRNCAVSSYWVVANVKPAKCSLIAGVLAVSLVAVVSACEIPVFRYALERWRSDLARVHVLHDAPLSAGEQSAVDQIRKQSIAAGGSLNLQVSVHQAAEPRRPEIAALWDSLPEDSAVLPQVIVRLSLGRGREATLWRGPLADFAPGECCRSPVLEKLVKRILAGDSVVWLMLKGTDAQQATVARKLLDQELARLEKSIELSEGIGLPGSELYAKVPLQIQFSVLEIAADDPRERQLVQLLRGFAPDAVADGQSLLVPVFGRGRALEVIPSSILDAELIAELTKFLCTACSCQVKELNPGFDLLLAARWEDELFDDERPPETELPRQGRDSRAATPPVLVPIPPGNADPLDRSDRE